MTVLHVVQDLPFPDDAVTETFALIGRKGAGKTYGAGRFVEELLEIKAQVVVVDTVGNWYGVRLSKTGKRQGYDLPVFGGEHGDVPLERTGGALVADVLVDRNVSVVLDLTLFNQSARGLNGSLLLYCSGGASASFCCAAAATPVFIPCAYICATG